MTNLNHYKMIDTSLLKYLCLYLYLLKLLYSGVSLCWQLRPMAVRCKTAPKPLRRGIPQSRLKLRKGLHTSQHLNTYLTKWCLSAAVVIANVQVRSAFLMVSESTGRSKGYGLIKYLSNEAAAQARQLLDNRDLDGFCLQVRRRGNLQLRLLLILLITFI